MARMMKKTATEKSPGERERIYYSFRQTLEVQNGDKLVRNIHIVLDYGKNSSYNSRGTPSGGGGGGGGGSCVDETT